MSLCTVLLISCLFSSTLGFNVHDLLLKSVADVSNATISDECKRDLGEYYHSLTNSSLISEWALKMLDSSVKIPNGILTGTMVHIGLFDECLSVVHPSGSFQGQHCMISANLEISAYAEHLKENAEKSLHSLQTFPGIMVRQTAKDSALSLALSLGICFPSTCSAADLNEIFNSSSLTAGTFSADEASCWTSEPKSLSAGSWGFISLVIILLVLVALSSAYEIIVFLDNKTPNKLLSAFSLYSNTKSMIEIRESSGEMACLHGIRTLSMMWVLLCHVYANVLSLPVINLTDSLNIMYSLDYVTITNGFYSVDSFFFLSGLLVAFVFFRNIGRKGSFDVPTAFIHRFLRLTPTFMFMVVFNITLLSDLNKGPLWNQVTNKESKACENNWWSSLLYVQNYVNPLESCLGQSWYLSADMQMFWISPLILYPLYIWPKLGIGFLGILILASTLWTFGIAYANNLKASLLLIGLDNQFSLDYVATHTRIMPWLVGLALGFAICAIKARRISIRLSKTWVLLGWISSTGICLGVIYGVNSFLQDPPAGTLDAAFYLSFTRTAWGVGLSWIVFACIYGYGGVVNSFLSLGIFQPLGKLSYNVYLVHLTVLLYGIGTTRTNAYISDWTSVNTFFSTLVFSYLFAVVLHLLVEAPMAVIDRELLKNLSIFPYPRPKINQKPEDSAEKGEHNQAFQEEQTRS